MIIVDHPSDPEVRLPPVSNTLYISINDWRNLHRWLRSACGVISYVRRAIGSGVDVALGREIDRYSVLAEADLKVGGSTPFYRPTGLKGRTLGMPHSSRI